MKLLLDQNLSRRLIPSLEPYYPGTTQVLLVGLEKATDAKIWSFANENGFVIVTKDSDFEELSILKKSPPKVILIKLGNTYNQSVLSALIDNHAYIEETLNQPYVSRLEIFK